MYLTICASALSIVLLESTTRGKLCSLFSRPWKINLLVSKKKKLVHETHLIWIHKFDTVEGLLRSKLLQHHRGNGQKTWVSRLIVHIKFFVCAWTRGQKVHKIFTIRENRYQPGTKRFSYSVIRFCYARSGSAPWSEIRKSVPCEYPWKLPEMSNKKCTIAGKKSRNSFECLFPFSPSFLVFFNV